MRIDDVNKGISRRKRPVRIGRGNGSGKGKTAGRGQDGQKSRRGFSRHPGKFGEDLPMVRRLPKRGFFNRYAATVIAINVGDLSQVYQAGEEVSPASLQAKGVVKKRFDEIKILGDGEIDKALNVSAHRFSKSAEEKITAAGGKVEKLKAKRTPAERVAALAKK
ncbi:MAG: 50S ribosomal protein L15 [Aureliella sp.]